MALEEMKHRSVKKKKVNEHFHSIQPTSYSEKIETDWLRLPLEWLQDQTAFVKT